MQERAVVTLKSAIKDNCKQSCRKSSVRCISIFWSQWLRFRLR